MAGKFYVTIQEKKFSVKVRLRSGREMLDNGELPLREVVTTMPKQDFANYLKARVQEAAGKL